MGVTRTAQGEREMSEGRDMALPKSPSAKRVPVDDIMASLSVSGRDAFTEGEGSTGGEMGSDPQVRALVAVSKLMQGARELSSVLPGAIPPELIALIDMVRVQVPKQLEQLSLTQGLMSPAVAPGAAMGMMGMGMGMGPEGPPMGGMGMPPGAGPAGPPQPGMPGMPGLLSPAGPAPGAGGQAQPPMSGLIPSMG
jgi:hypothetical protein